MLLVEQIRELREMLASPGWRLFAATVQEQQDNAVAELVSNRLSSLDETLAQEFTKGGIARVAAVMALPETMIEQFAADAKQMEKSNESAE